MMRPTFTSHNVRLDNGSSTMPEKDHTLEHYSSFRAAKRTLALVYPLIDEYGDGRFAGRAP